MSASMTIVAAFRSRLVSAAGTLGLTGSDVQPDRPTREDIPCIVYNVQSREGARVLGQAESTGVEIGFEVDLWAETYTNLRNMQEAVEEALEGLRGATSVSGIGTAYFHNVTLESADDRPLFPMPGEPDGLYRASLVFSVMATN